MTRFATGLLLLTIVCLLPVFVNAQTDHVGATDTVFADISRIDSLHWTVTVNYFNDEVVRALSVPLKLTAGLNKIVADSASFVGGRVEDFRTGFRADTAIQCMLLGILGIVPGHDKLQPGYGRLATVYVSSLENKPITKLNVDTTTVNPNNSLMSVADSMQPGKTERLSNTDVQIFPAFVVRRQQ